MHMPNLKQILALDAASCALFCAAGVGAAATVASLTGLPREIVAGAGWICLPAAIFLAVAALRPSRALVGALAATNAGWVLASLIVWVAHFSQLTPLGHALVIAQAAAVELFALLEWRGFKALGGHAAPA